MLSPPRLPALWVAFNAGASAALSRASVGATGKKICYETNAFACSNWMH